jgi:electron transfer flavoprotein beta subunit
MNMVICVKPVPDINVASLNSHTNRIDDDDLLYIINPYDARAVEEGVRIKESIGVGQVTLVSVAPPQTKRLLHHCLALGADESILLWDTGFDISDSYATAKILAKAIVHLQYDLVLCGKEAIDDEAAQVGAVLAELLGIPWVSRVGEIQTNGEHDRIKVIRKLGKGKKELCEVDLPALLSVDIELGEAKYPTLPSLLAALRKEIQEYDLKALGLTSRDVGVSGSKVRIIGMSLAKPRVKKVFTPDSALPPEERVRQLMTGGMTKRSSNFLEGDPKSIVSNIVKFLSKEKLF